MKRTKIVLDADVVIHFSKGGYLAKLSEIFPDYEYVVLSVVYKELLPPVKKELDNVMFLLKRINLINFEPTNEMRREYARLTGKYGKGESACMSYCRYNHDVVGSSNLKDIKEYCEANQITYLTTIDFLYHAIQKGIMTVEEANGFVADVIAKGSKLPTTDFHTFVSAVML